MSAEKSGLINYVARQKWIIVILLLVHGITITYSVVVPFVVGAALRAPADGGLGLPPSLAGMLVTTELLAVAVGTGLSATVLLRVNEKVFALIGAAFMILGNVATFFLAEEGTEILFALRVLTGLAAGMTNAIAYAATSRQEQPDRLFAMMTVLGPPFAAIALILAPIMTTEMGHHGLWVLFACSTLVLAPSILLLPKRPEAMPEHADEDGKAINIWAVAPLSILAVAMASAILNVGDGALYSFMEEFGGEIGVTPDQVGVVLGVAGIIGLFGGVVVAVLGTRIGRALPLAVALLIKAVFGILLITSDDYASFFIYQQVLSITFYMTLPYFGGLCAAIDPHGRAASVVGSATVVGYAFSSGIGGFVLHYTGDWMAVGICAAVAMLITAVLLVPVARRYDHIQKKRDAKENSLEGSLSASAGLAHEH